MKINIVINTKIVIKRPNLKHITYVVLNMLKNIFQQVVVEVVINFAKEHMKNGKLAERLKCKKVRWKTSKGNRTTKIRTIFGYITIPQFQIEWLDNNGVWHKMYIVRMILGIEKWKRIPEYTKRVFAMIGALAPYRAVMKILEIMSGIKVPIMDIWRSVQSVGKNIKFDVDENESNVFEGDGTGIPVPEAGKRGEELKVLAQRKKRGGIRLAGINIGKYKKGWDKLFKPLRDKLKSFGEIVLITDGDTNIFKGVGKKVRVILQRCLWHIPHETKYTLWQDKVKRKSAIWKYILARIILICNVKRLYYEEDDVIDKIIDEKMEMLNKLINSCKNMGYTNTYTFLLNSKNDIFGGIQRGIKGGTTSLVERVMRTINNRINVGTWSPQGSLNVCKIRGAYYYNDWSI